MALSTQAVPAFGVMLQLCEDASSTNPINIAEVKDINDSYNAQVEDVTTHNTLAAWRTRIATLLDLGVELQLNFVGTDPTHDHLTGLKWVWRQREERTYILTPSDGSIALTFNAVISNIKGTFPVGGVRGASVTLMSSGVPDFGD